MGVRVSRFRRWIREGPDERDGSVGWLVGMVLYARGWGLGLES